ncbi:MAG: hypothetical protein VKO65_08835 [Cyanobacteriota bacterium]|nr:hypothetical protein [Cyanobacteriota bacterium]
MVEGLTHNPSSGFRTAALLGWSRETINDRRYRQSLVGSKSFGIALTLAVSINEDDLSRADLLGNG